MTPRHPRVVALFGVVVVAGATLLGAAPAQAHNFLVSSTPAADEVVTALPETFSVTTNGPLLDLSGTGAGFAIQVTDATGAFYGDGCMTVSGSTLSTPAALGAAGTYRFVWQVISEDGHTVSDEFTFEWAPAADAEPDRRRDVDSRAYGHPRHEARARERGPHRRAVDRWSDPRGARRCSDRARRGLASARDRPRSRRTGLAPEPMKKSRTITRAALLLVAGATS